MAKHVLELLGSKELRQNMGRAGLHRVEPAFCDRDMVRRIEAVYDSCMVN
jgi:hypothetical protein